MQHAALGVRMHSGWGVLVAIAESTNSVEVLARRRIITMDPATPGAKQPYHFAEGFALPLAERHIKQCAAVSEHLSYEALEAVVRTLEERQVSIVGAALLAASGRVLPSLEKILAAHPLLHAAEGEFFRHAVRVACDRLGIPLTAISERELEGRAHSAFGNAARGIQNNISSVGSSIGPPWTADHKNAALAAAIVLTAH